jgi:hypothetical protein
VVLLKSNRKDRHDYIRSKVAAYHVGDTAMFWEAARELMPPGCGVMLNAELRRWGNRRPTIQRRSIDAWVDSFLGAGAAGPAKVGHELNVYPSKFAGWHHRPLRVNFPTMENGSAKDILGMEISLPPLLSQEITQGYNSSGGASALENPRTGLGPRLRKTAARRVPGP